MPSLSELPGEIKRKKFIRALSRLGFLIDKSGGDGSHCKIIWPSTQKMVVVQTNLRKDVLYYVLKEIKAISGLSWDDIKKEL